jgi:hypothetical protein
MDRSKSLRLLIRLLGVTSVLAISGAGPNLPSGGAMDPESLESSARPQPSAAAALSSPRLAHFGRIPLCFEANQDQADPQVQYLARGPGYTVFLTATEAVLSLNSTGPEADSLRRPALSSTNGRIAASASSSPEKRDARRKRAVVRMQLLDSNPAAMAEGLDRLPGIAIFRR